MFFFSASSLTQQFVGIYVAPHRHIILIPGLEPTVYRPRIEHSKSYNTK